MVRSEHEKCVLKRVLGRVIEQAHTYRTPPLKFAKFSFQDLNLLHDEYSPCDTHKIPRDHGEGERLYKLARTFWHDHVVKESSHEGRNNCTGNRRDFLLLSMLVDT
jgi:hypothetical protein